ncbi:hypothetical protein [Variovorax sp. PvP013]|uniref:hypothetical protein n=1 Tax=Variovorax sp. PvP013 TaxID=3156435 RepID=UPI003D1EB63C
MHVKKFTRICLTAALISTTLFAWAQVTEANIGNMKFVGTSTPQGSPPWDVSINFANGLAVWSKPDGARAERNLSSYSINGNRLSIKLQAKSPVGIPDLICDGTVSGRLIDAQCMANAGGPPEKLVGRLE